MKKSKKIISLLLTIQMLFACTLVPSAMATDSVVEEPIDEAVEAIVIDEGESSEELSPMMANECEDYYISGRPYVPANAIPVAGKNGVRIVKPNTSTGFINFLIGLGLGFSGQGWQYSMQDFYIPGESTIYYDHYWFHEDYPGSVYHHRRP